MCLWVTSLPFFEFCIGPQGLLGPWGKVQRLHSFLKKSMNYFLAVLGLHCCVWAFSVVVSGGCSPVVVHRLFIAVASLVSEYRLQGARTQWLWHIGLVAMWHLGSSWTRDRTHGPCIGRQILNHWTTREVLNLHSCIYCVIICCT